MRPKQYCGMFEADGDIHYILPKIAKEHRDVDKTNLNIFIYMLIYAYDIPLRNEDITACANEKNHLLEVLIQYFAHTLLTQLQQGVYKSYITKQEALPMLKGKYLIIDNLINSFTADKIHSEYDEHTMDNPLNRFFLFAIKQLLPYAKDKSKLKACLLIFDEVSYRPFNAHQIDSTPFHQERLTIRFKRSFDIALLLLKRCLPLWDRDKQSFAFLFDMNVLFERFIGKIIQSIEPSTILQQKTSFGDFILEPNIVIPNRLIIDTKYKKLKRDYYTNKLNLKSDDKNQVYTYGKNFNISNTMLLYPKYYEYIRPFDLSLGKGKNCIMVQIRLIDLNTNTNNYQTYIETIINRMEEIINGK